MRKLNGLERWMRQDALREISQCKDKRTPSTNSSTKGGKKKKLEGITREDTLEGNGTKDKDESKGGVSVLLALAVIALVLAFTVMVYL